jgi:hypothetical protein
MEKISHPKGLRRKMVKNAEKSSLIAIAINIKFLQIFISFLSLSKF